MLYYFDYLNSVIKIDFIGNLVEKLNKYIRNICVNYFSWFSFLKPFVFIKYFFLNCSFLTSEVLRVLEM